MTGTDLLVPLRQRISDQTGTSPNDTDIIFWINEFTSQFWDTRADKKFDDNGNMRDMTPITALGDTIDLPDCLQGDLLNALAGEFLGWRRNAEDTAKGREYTATFRSVLSV